MEVNGTLCYHFKYTPKMVKPKEEAIEYFKRRLKNRNVFQATIDECRDDPKKLEKLLDKILWTYDAIKRLKWFDFDIDPPAVSADGVQEGRREDVMAVTGEGRAEEGEAGEVEEEKETAKGHQEEGHADY